MGKTEITNNSRGRTYGICKICKKVTHLTNGICRDGCFK